MYELWWLARAGEGLRADVQKLDGEYNGLAEIMAKGEANGFTAELLDSASSIVV